MSFVSDYLHYTREYESPTSFWKWSAYAAIASVLRDNVYIMMGDKPLFPNIYVLLLADSAVQRKDNPVNTAAALIQHVNNTKVINGRSSIQGILDELARGETDKATGQIKKGGSAIWIAPEMSAGIVNDPEAIKILTDIYTFRERYDSRLRTQANFSIKNICFSFLAASNEELLRDVYDIKATMGGLLGRTFLITPNEFRKGNSLFRVDSKRMIAERKHIEELLSKFSLLRGEFTVEDDAIDLYDEWYIPFRDSYEKQGDRSGISGRIHTSVVKVAMLIAVSETSELVIRKNQMRCAIQECTDLIPNYRKFVMSSGKSSLAEIATIVLSAIFEEDSKELSRKEILQRFWNVFDQGAETLDKLITTLEQGGMISTYVNGSEVSYKMTDRCIQILFQKEKK